MERQLEGIANELLLRAEIMKNLPRMADNDEYDDILKGIAVDEAIEMHDYLNR